MLQREPGLWYACYMNEAPKSYIGNEYTLLSTKVGEKINSAYHSVTIHGDIILISCHVVKSLQLIWRSGTRK